ncbi:MAG: TolC family protein [Sphingomonas bacterium]
MAILSLSGCGGMSGRRPPTLAQLGVADLYSGGQKTPQPIAAADLAQWWRGFDDPQLDALIERARADDPAAGKKGKARYLLEQERIATEAGIARSYVMLRARQAKIENIRSHLAARQDDEVIARFREEAKLVTSRDALQVAAESDRVAATIPALESAIAADVARIAVLTGQAPVMLRGELAATRPIPVGPSDVAVGAPSDLLARRPEARLAALRIAPARPWGGGTGAATAAYKQTVLRMIEETENARSAFAAAKARVAALDKAVDDAEQLALMTRKHYREGLADYVALEGAERALLAVRNERVDALADRARALIDLFAALGGGWEMEADGDHR